HTTRLHLPAIRVHSERSAPIAKDLGQEPEAYPGLGSRGEWFAIQWLLEPRSPAESLAPWGPNGAERRHPAQHRPAKNLSFSASASGSSPPFAFSTYAVTAHCRDQLFQLARTRSPQVSAVRDALGRVISAHLSP